MENRNSYPGGKKPTNSAAEGTYRKPTPRPPLNYGSPSSQSRSTQGGTSTQSRSTQGWSSSQSRPAQGRGSYQGSVAQSRSAQTARPSVNGRVSASRSESKRRRRREPPRGLALLLAACLIFLAGFGVVKGVNAIRHKDDVEYYLPVKITEPPQDDCEPFASGQEAPTENVSQPAADHVVAEEPVAPAQPEVLQNDAPTIAPEAEDDSGYFPEGEDTAFVQTERPAVSNGSRKATLRFAGDVVADKNILNAAYNSKTGKYSFSKFFSLIRGQLSNADYTVMNVDGSMGGEKYYKYGYSGYPQFNTPPTILYALQECGVDCLSLANNHCLDGWFEGLKQTIVNCDYVGMDHFGAYSSQEERNAPEIFEVNGIRIGLLNYTQSLNSMDKAGVDPAALEYGLRRTANADYAGDIQKLKQAGAEVVIVYMHWGEEYLFEPDQNQRNMAKQIAAAGADVIVGGHPHVAQAGGWISTTDENGNSKQVLAIYSLGNFLSEHRNENKAKTDSGVIFEFTLQENAATGKIEVVAPKYVPIAVWRTGSDGGYDYRVVSVDNVVANRPDGMNDSAYARMVEISQEMSELYGKSNFERVAD